MIRRAERIQTIAKRLIGDSLVSSLAWNPVDSRFDPDRSIKGL